jgi:hypothetical protein
LKVDFWSRIKEVPANTEHLAFKQPSNPDIKIWRYMDFTKYVSMLDLGGLYFPRADLLGDPFEGSYSHANVEAFREMLEESAREAGQSLNVPEMLEESALTRQWYRQWIYISSWHMNEYESAAMWRVYARSNEAIAVQSTYAKLRDCLPGELELEAGKPANAVYVGEIQYVDYESEMLPEGNMFHLFMHKRKSFEHERELRAVIWDTSPALRHIDLTVSNSKMGVPVGVSLGELIEAVYVAPTAPDWFRNLVEAITRKYGLIDKPIVRSSLDADPVY